MTAIDWGTIALVFNNVSVHMVPTAMFLNFVMILVSFLGFGAFVMFVHDVITEGQTYEEIEPCKVCTDIPMAVQIANRERTWRIQKAYTLAGNADLDMACFEIDVEPEIPVNEIKVAAVKANTKALLADLEECLGYASTLIKIEDFERAQKVIEEIKHKSSLFSKPEFLLV
jgi:hypothetical protein